MFIKHYFYTPDYEVAFDFDSQLVWNKIDAMDLLMDYRSEGRKIVYSRNQAFEMWEIENSK